MEPKAAIGVSPQSTLPPAQTPVFTQLTSGCGEDHLRGDIQTPASVTNISAASLSICFPDLKKNNVLILENLSNIEKLKEIL